MSDESGTVLIIYVAVSTSEHAVCSAAARSAPRKPTETKLNCKTRRITCFNRDQNEVNVNPAQDVCNK